MSGGSHNYLYLAYQVSGLYGRQDDIEFMSTRLKELGFNELAEVSLVILKDMQVVYDHAEKLERVWKAVEWYDSGDWGLDDVEQAAKEYKP